MHKHRSQVLVLVAIITQRYWPVSGPHSYPQKTFVHIFQKNKSIKWEEAVFTATQCTQYICLYMGNNTFLHCKWWVWAGKTIWHIIWATVWPCFMICGLCPGVRFGRRRLVCSLDEEIQYDPLPAIRLTLPRTFNCPVCSFKHAGGVNLTEEVANISAFNKETGNLLYIRGDL